MKSVAIMYNLAYVKGSFHQVGGFARQAGQVVGHQPGGCVSMEKSPRGKDLAAQGVAARVV